MKTRLPLHLHYEFFKHKHKRKYKHLYSVEPEIDSIKKDPGFGEQSMSTKIRYEESTAREITFSSREQEGRSKNTHEIAKV